MSEALDEYRILQRELFHSRSHIEGDSPEEDQILDRMDGAWWRLTDAEREEIEPRELP